MRREIGSLCPVLGHVKSDASRRDKEAALRKHTVKNVLLELLSHTVVLFLIF